MLYFPKSNLVHDKQKPHCIMSRFQIIVDHALCFNDISYKYVFIIPLDVANSQYL